MEFENSNFLSPAQKVREREVIKKYFNLMSDERPRYVKQAEELLIQKSIFTQSDKYNLAYAIQDDFYICDGNPESPHCQSFSIGVPIPNTSEEKIETLIELFAQAEAGLIVWLLRNLLNLHADVFGF